MTWSSRQTTTAEAEGPAPATRSGSEAGGAAADGGGAARGSGAARSEVKVTSCRTIAF